jgi:hypothetical protein
MFRGLYFSVFSVVIKLVAAQVAPGALFYKRKGYGDDVEKQSARFGDGFGFHPWLFCVCETG